jgi:AcrR family transcriptional regulator
MKEQLKNMGSSRIRARVLDAAVELFGAYGIYGVTFHDLAKKAKVTSGSIYRLFSTREILFEEAIKSVREHSLDPANFLLMIFEEQKGHDFPSLATAAVRTWYYSFSQPAARLLMQATFLDHKWDGPEGPIEKIIKVLATAMERELKKSKAAKLDSRTAARVLVLSLFQLKLSLPASVSAKEEKETVEGILQLWLRALSGAL